MEPTNAEFRPTPAQARLDAEVKARMEKQKAANPNAQPVDYQALAETLKNAGLGDITPGDLAASMVHLQRKKAIQARQEARRTEGRPELTQTSQEIALAMAKLAGGQMALPMSPDELEAIDRETKAMGQKLSWQMQRDNIEAYIAKVIPDQFRGTFAMGLVKPDVNRDEIRKVTGWKFGPKGLYVYGPSGRSKSWAIYALVERLLREGRTVTVLDGAAFSIQAGAAFSEAAKTEAWLKTMLAPDVLFIDDLGKRWTPATEDAAFAVIDRRTSRKKPILTSVNYTGEELQRMSNARGELAAVRDITTPLRRRLTDYCTRVIF
jgi:DNA replication protein DnaC